ncbi:MAG: hypothetical protein K2Q22_17695 [Cytophagales bacterium]|nr:hypothetical protein [Cytophagales bacterium]
MEWIKQNLLQLVILLMLGYLLVEVHMLKTSVTASGHESEMTNVKLDYVVSDINTKVLNRQDQRPN